MSFDKNEELLDYEMIYRPNDNEQKIFYEIKEENNAFEMIYKPNENKNEKKKKLYTFSIFNDLHLIDSKEYSGEVLRILDKYFVKNNKNKGKLIYKNKKYELKEYLEEIDNNYKDKDIIKLKIYGINNISDMSRMFYGCYHLTSFSEYSNQQNINDSIDIFSEDNSYTFLKEEIKTNDDSRLIEDNNSGLVYDLNKEYIELPFLSSIHKDNDNNILSGINSLLNNIETSLLKRKRILKMEKMFYGCFSLISISEISKWNTSNVINMSDMFNGCTSLISLPNISKWNTMNITYMNNIFKGCSSLISLPDISKWDTNNVTDMNSMFEQCYNLLNIY